MKFIVSIFILMLFSCKNEKNKSSAQKDIAQLSINIKLACSYSSEIKEGNIYTFTAGKDAEQAIKDILAQTGLPQNFKIAASDVDNAIAVIQPEGGKQIRYILYNQEFFKTVEEKTKTRFAALSILAHEIGHHLSGHTLNNDGSRPLLEIESDIFSGFILKKMGASLAEAQIAVKTFCPVTGSSTHPPQSARLAAITNGWIDANGSQPNVNQDQAEPFKYTHEISDAPMWSIALRSRVLTPAELNIINNPKNPEKVNIDARTLIAALQPKTKVLLINNKNPDFYEIGILVNGEKKTGFITKRVYKQNTIVPLPFVYNEFKK